jgi:predicted metal-binding membrane protein
MTPVVLYQYVARVALFVGGSVLIWMAVFLLLCWLLHYEPRQIDPVPMSRRERIVVSTLAAGVGATILVLTVTGGFDFTSTRHRPVFGCMSALCAISSLLMLWASIVEPRRAVRLWRQELVRQPGEQP